eukprot:jgi/Botrbrau1/16766/Bobra.150_2s0002.1
MQRGIRMKTTGAVMFLSTLLLGMVSVESATRFCTTLPKGALRDGPNITIWGQETMVAFGSGFREIQGAKPGVEGPWLAPLITAVVLFAISASAVLRAPKDATILYWLIALYPLGTAVVEVTRVNFDASRFGFITAALHNLFEYGMILFAYTDYDTAVTWWPATLLFGWAIDMWILFVPALPFKVRGLAMKGVFWAGLLEQLTGIVCDFLLINLYCYWWTKSSHAEQPRNHYRLLGNSHNGKSSTDKSVQEAYKLALIGAALHMLEIGPLVLLLSGLVPRPFIPISVLVAFTTPITMWFYSLEAAPRLDFIVRNKQPIPFNDGLRIFAISLASGWGLILLPGRLLPHCT